MKQTIEIEVPDGKKAIWKDDKVVFEDIKPQLPKTWEEFCNTYNIQSSEYFIDYNSDIIRVHPYHTFRLICKDSNLLPNKQAAEAHLALMQLHQLRDCYRQGWVPDLDDEKFVITASYKGLYSICKCIKTREFLSFQSRETAEEFLTNFRELIEQAGDLI